MPLPTAEVKFPHAESDAITTGCILMLNVDLKVRNLLSVKGMEYQYFDEVTSNQQMFSEMVPVLSKIGKSVV